MQQENQHSLQRKQEQESEGKKQGLMRAVDTLVLFEKIIPKCG